MTTVSDVHNRDAGILSTFTRYIAARDRLSARIARDGKAPFLDWASFEAAAHEYRLTWPETVKHPREISLRVTFQRGSGARA
jgi:hypothetical protein